MRWLRRIGIAFLILVVLGVTATLTTPYWLPLIASRLEPWIRSEIMNVISIYIKPVVTIQKIEYTWPLSVSVSGVSMTAVHPTTKKPVEILSFDHAEITLNEIPSTGEQLIFRDFKVESPKIVVEVLEDGTVVGWDDFLRDTSDQPQDVKPSEIFAIDVVEVLQFTFEYALEGYEDRMVLDKLDFTIDNKGKVNDKDVELPHGEGWYVVDTELTRSNLFSIGITGGIDIDALDVAIDRLHLVVEINSDSAQFLPPQVQEIVHKHDLEGHVDVSAHARFDIDDIEDTDATFHLELAKSHAAFKDVLIEIDSAEANFLYKDQILSTDDGKISMLSGELNFTGMLEQADPNDPRTAGPDKQQLNAIAEETKGVIPSIALKTVSEAADDLELTLNLKPNGLKIQEFHRVGEELADLAGSVDGVIDLNANLGHIKSSLLGSGDISISDGIFGNNTIMKAFSSILKVALLGLGHKDRADAIFAIKDETINFSSLSILISPIGIRGGGWIKFDETLYFSVNAGPLEGFQQSVGGLGKILGIFTDVILKYVVTGTTKDPHISVAPLGIGS